jgi:hypothetical protein
LLEPPALPVVVDDQVPTDLQDPILKTPGLGSVAFKVLINLNEYLLSQVLRFLRTPGIAVAKVVNSSGIIIYDALPRRVVTLKTALYKFLFAREHSPLLLSNPAFRKR